MTASATETYPLTRDAHDARADGNRRVVRISEERIAIDRNVNGVRMNITVPVTAYRCLVLDVRLQAATASLRLAHADAELDVVLASGEAISVAKQACTWAAFFDKKIALEESCVTIGTAFGRQRNRKKRARRSSFARGRRVGSPGRMGMSFAGEREIIART